MYRSYYCDAGITLVVTPFEFEILRKCLKSNRHDFLSARPDLVQKLLDNMENLYFAGTLKEEEE